METNQLQGPDLGVINSLKFAWKNQGKIIKLLACPILFQLAGAFINLYLSSSLQMQAMNANMSGSPLPSAATLTGSQIGLFGAGVILSILSGVMIIVRFYRFYLSKDDPSQVPFFSFGGREWRVLGYGLLMMLGMFLFIGVILVGPVFLQIPALIIGAGIIGLIAVFYAGFRLTFIFPDIALDRSVSISRAWHEMKGSVGILVWKMILASLILVGMLVLPTVLVSMAIGFVGSSPQIGLVGSALLNVYTIWVTILLYALMYRIMSNLYRYKVLDRV